MSKNELNYSAELYDEDEDMLKDRYLTFRIGDEDYGVEIRYVTEIIGIQKITEVPNISDYIKGVINLRGLIIPIISVRLRFGLPEIEYDDRTCIITVRAMEHDVGLIVDSVAEVINLPYSNISDAPNTNKRNQGKFIYGLGQAGDDVKIILDMMKLLFDGRKI